MKDCVKVLDGRQVTKFYCAQLTGAQWNPSAVYEVWNKKDSELTRFVLSDFVTLCKGNYIFCKDQRTLFSWFQKPVLYTCAFGQKVGVEWLQKSGSENSDAAPSIRLPVVKDEQKPGGLLFIFYHRVSGVWKESTLVLILWIILEDTRHPSIPAQYIPTVELGGGSMLWERCSTVYQGTSQGWRECAEPQTTLNSHSQDNAEVSQGQLCGCP